MRYSKTHTHYTKGHLSTPKKTSKNREQRERVGVGQENYHSTDNVNSSLHRGNESHRYVEALSLDSRRTGHHNAEMRFK